MNDKGNITQALAAFTDSEMLTSVAARGFYEALGVTMKENQRIDDPILIDEEMYKRATDSDRMPAALRQAFSHVTNSYLVGSIDDHNLDNIADDGQTKDMLFFAVDTDRTLNRTDAANLTRLFNRMARKNPVALVIRHADDTIHLALCERTDYVQQWRQGQKIGRVRIMMNIRCREPHRGHIDMLHTIADKQYLTYDELYKHWLHVFSVQTLTRRFYSELQDWYFRAVRLAKFPNDVNRSDDYQAHNAEALIRFLTRFIFVWFLKHKGLVNDDLFQEDKLGNILKDFRPQDDNDGCYYNAILQNLFFATLNRKIDERRFIEWFEGKSKEYDIKTFYRCRKLFNNSLTDEEIKTLFNRTPYVNGSLFDCLDNRPAKDAQGNETTLSLDGFSNTHADKRGIIKQAFIPNSLFFRPEDTDVEVDLRADYGCTHRVRAVGLINIFNRYYFTVEENTPLDEQIALDPELLGRVFENLLGAFNPETQNNSRNSTGSFYTPREIVEYMCDESLRAYLNTCLPECADSIKALLDGNSETVNPGHREPLMRAIYNCRILDPACGSGAFPMGLLQRLVDCLRLLDPDNSDWRKIVEDETIKATARTYRDRQLSDDERQSILKDIAANFNRRTANADFARKLYIIQHSIHGVDIQPIAIMISKLRFFISLLCEQQANDKPKDNYGILTLPNLETNLVCANSLVGVKRLKKGVDFHGDLFDNQEIARTKEELINVRAGYFNARTTKDKQKQRDKDKKLREHLALLLQKDQAYAPDDTHQLAEWDPYDSVASAPFFDAEWMFGISTGFNIVIGNPPYIQLEYNGGELGLLYQDKGYNVFSRSSDIYCLFYEQAHRLLADGGHACLITSNKWMRAGYGEATRQFLGGRITVKQNGRETTRSVDCRPQLLIDFAGTRVFESATVDVNILLYGHNTTTNTGTRACTFKSTDALSAEGIKQYVGDNAVDITFAPDEPWIVLSRDEQAIKRKIEAAGTPLKHWDVQINYGIKTGFNPAFIIDTDTRNNILARCLSDDERQRTEKLIRPVLRGRDIKRYGYRWADLWLINTHNGVKEAGIPRIDINDYPAVKEHLDSFGNKLAKRQDQGDTPYNLRNCAYLQDFDKPKIVWKRVGSIIRFAYDDKKILSIDSTCFAIGESIEFLCGVLNSKIGHYLLQDSPKTGTGDLLISVQAVEPIRVPRVSAEQQKPIVDLVRRVLASKAAGEDTAALERDIDRLVCDLYGLTAEERALIGCAE